MIKILIRFEEKNFKSLEVKGHANSGPKGHDLVCAAISAIITGCTNAIKDENKFKLDCDDGYYKLEAIDSLSPHDETVVETIIVGLKTIAEGNDKFIQIKNL